MNNAATINLGKFVERLKSTYRWGVYVAQWALCIASVLFVWGGAIWFGSLGFEQKQGAVLFFMGVGGWLAMSRYVVPALWFLSIETLKRLGQLALDRMQ